MVVDLWDGYSYLECCVEEDERLRFKSSQAEPRSSGFSGEGSIIQLFEVKVEGHLLSVGIILRV